MSPSRPITIAVAAILSGLIPAASVASSGGPDAAGYTWADSTEPTGPLYNYLFAANPLTTLGDDDSDVLTLGWNFPFYGTSYGQVEVHSNGVITFGTSALPISWINTCSLGPEAPIAAPFWDDFNPLSGGIVYYGNFGVSPNRVFVVEWYLMSNWTQTGNASFQVQLHEATGAVEFHYDDVDLSDPGGDDWGGDATVGTSGGGNTFQLSCLSPTLSNGFAVGFYPGPACTDDDLDGYCDDVDCDDANALVNPGQNEVCDGIDNDCDVSIDEGFDNDADGFTTCNGDCDDNNVNVFPGATEVCDGIDNDCDVSIDEGFDNDADGFTTCNGDCDDSNSLVNPGALEACNGVDDNCNGVVDDAPDVDNDGVNICAGDCDDGDAANYPGNTEVCDGGDNNCDGTIDEGFDVDGDGVTTCGGDCDDNNGLISPAASEVCDGIDNNCNGEIDENADNDNDGVSNCDGDCDDDNPLVFPGAVEHCNEVDDDCDEEIDEGFDSDGDGWSACGGDCNDNFDTVNPDAVEVCDGMDTDCDGEITDDQDLDLDGFTPCDDDCDDADPAVFPGAEEVLDDGIDQDCDGIDQTSSGTTDDDDAPPGDDDDVVSLGGGSERESVGALGCTCGAEIAPAEGTPMSWMLLLAAALGVSRRRFRRMD
jgi:hypothetical protein